MDLKKKEKQEPLVLLYMSISAFCFETPDKHKYRTFAIRIVS